MALRVSSESVEQVDGDRDTLIRGWDEVMRAIKTSLDIPKQVLGAGTINCAKLGTRQAVVVRIAQRVRLEGSALLLIVEHKSAVDKLDVTGVVGRAGPTQHHNYLAAG